MFLYRSWSEAPDNVKASDPEYYDSLITDNSYYVQVLDSNGKSLSSSMLEIDNPDSLSPLMPSWTTRAIFFCPLRKADLWPSPWTERRPIIQ